MKTLAKCSLCENKEDPRFGAEYRKRRWPLCDGCGGPEDAAQAQALFAKLDALPWSPPFCGTLVENVECPECGDENVHVREQESYLDGSDYRAFCSTCHKMMTIWATVDVAFHGPELDEPDDTETGSKSHG